MLLVKNEEGKWINIPTVLGPKGDSAYETVRLLSSYTIFDRLVSTEWNTTSKPSP